LTLTQGEAGSQTANTLNRLMEAEQKMNFAASSISCSKIHSTFDIFIFSDFLYKNVKYEKLFVVSTTAWLISF